MWPGEEVAEEDGDQGRPRDMQRREGSRRRREELQGPETVKSQGGVRGWGGGLSGEIGGV